MVSFLKRKKTRLGNKDIPLGEFVFGYHLSSPLYIDKEDVMYVASSHEVVYRVLIPGGPQGRSSITIPKKIKTFEDLLEYLKESHGFRLKDMHS